MRQIFITFISTIIFFGCSTKKKENVVYHVIKHPKVDPSSPIPSLGETYYGQYNFVLLDTSKIFFHDKFVAFYCGTGVDFSRPPYLGLTPDSLREIKINDLQVFLNSIPDPVVSDRHFYVSISYPNDTIRNRAFKIITDYLKNKNKNRYDIRNWTEEEKYVTTAKIENKTYDPDTIHWKIGFGGYNDPSLPNDTLTTIKANKDKLLFYKDKSFEILNSRRGITTESSSPDTSVCKNWTIKPVELKKIIINSKSIDGHTWHDDFGVYPCVINGEIKQNGQTFKFEVNAGSWMYVFCPDTTLILGNYKKQDEKYFLSNAWDGN